MTMVQIDGEAVVAVPREPKKMITVHTDEATGKTLVEINSSSLSVIQECPRKSQYLLYEKWIAADEHPGTLLGSGLHTGLETFYSGTPEERIMVPLEQLQIAALGNKTEDDDNLLVRSVRAFAKRAAPLAGLPNTDKRSIANGAWILYHYFKHYIDDPYITYVDTDGPFVERQFTLRVYEDTDLIIDVFGTIDIALVNTKTGDVLPGDHKSTSSFGFGESSYFDREKPNHQYSLYAMGARRVFGIQSNNFLINMLGVKSRYSPKLHKETGPPDFARQLTARSEEDFEELIPVVLRAAKDYLNCIETNNWPLGPVSSCNLYGACTYKQVCASPKSLRENILRSKFSRA